MRKPLSYVLFGAVIAAAAGGFAAAQFVATPPDFLTGLSGLNEVPPRPTAATGNAQFKLIEDGNAIAYRLIVSDITNVTAAHIHLGPPGVNAPVVAFLAGDFPPGGGPVEGVLATGVIRTANLRGPLAGQDISVLIAAMRSGGTYVNVHTNDGIEPINTGAGDFPGGEIRGQIIRARDRVQSEATALQ
ncbi:MAG TPA: CHRD domain-containing protein [Candidatus Polarisedimenticolia bacterium]|nr:CHRD domain-containing protein [Candidatus Polarisedimenticolia bacterium]